MKASGLCTLLFFALAAFCQLSTKEQASQPYIINISAVKPTFKLGARIELKVQKTNISSHDINGSANYAGGTIVGYHCDLRDSTGAVVQKKERMNPSGPPIPAELSARLLVLKPNESVVYNTFACKDFDINQPGEYTVQLYEQINGNNSDEVVKSNIITITIVAPENKEPEEDKKNAGNKLPTANPPSGNDIPK